MIKTIKMLNVIKDIQISIIVNKNVISIKDKDNKQLFFKMVNRDNDQINTIVSTLINNHFEKGYVIMSMDMFNIE